MKPVTLNLSEEYFSSLNTSDSALTKAAKKVARDAKSHFKKDGWDLNYSILIADVFHEAYGHHLENYLLKALHKSLKQFTLATGKHGDLVVRVSKEEHEKPTKKSRSKDSRKLRTGRNRRGSRKASR